MTIINRMRDSVANVLERMAARIRPPGSSQSRQTAGAGGPGPRNTK